MLPVVLCLVTPSLAWANAGTALIWARAFHLLFGNAVIGLAEGLVLAALFKSRRRSAVGLMIVANYASAWAGGALFLQWLAPQVPVDIENLRLWFWAFVVLAFAATLAIELPFVRLALGRRPNGWRAAIRGTLIVNAISYPVLFGCYWLASGTSLLTSVSVVRAAELQPSRDYVLYYLTRDGGVMRSDLTGVGRAKVAKLGTVDHNDRLYVRPDAAGGFDLFAVQISENRNKQWTVPVLQNFAENAAIDERMRRLEGQEADMSWYNFGDVAKLGADSPWSMRVGFWPVEGLSGRREESGERFQFSLETPFVQWLVRNATHLKGDLVLFQLGDDQICLLDPLGKRIALVARGQGPVVALGVPRNPLPAEAVPADRR